MQPDESQFPRREIGTWRHYRELPWPQIPADSPDIVRHLLTDCEIQLLHGPTIVSRHPVETAPIIYGNLDDRSLVLSPDGRWLWYLGHKNGAPHVTLLEATSLKKIASITPQTVWPDGNNVPIEFWQYPTVEIPDFNQNILLIWNNACDHLHYLMVLQATPYGIVDLVGQELLVAVQGILDEFAGDITFASADLLLVLDDVSQLSLFEWRTKTRIASYNIYQALSDDSYMGNLAPIDDGEYELLNAGPELYIIDGHLIAIDVSDGSFNPTLGFVLFEATTLKPIGFVRPPIKGKELSYFGEQEFGYIENDKIHLWKLEI